MGRGSQEKGKGREGELFAEGIDFTREMDLMEQRNSFRFINPQTRVWPAFGVLNPVARCHSEPWDAVNSPFSLMT